VGERLGNYDFLERIGRGAYGEVWRARQRSLDREVAVKLLREEIASDPAAVEAFLAEARLTARLHHHGLVNIYDVGEAGGRPFFSMEYLAGGSLRAALDRRGRLPEAEAIPIALAILDALAHAHREGIVHRDVKPLNILFAENGHPQLVDLGISEAIGEHRGVAGGTVVGSAPYMSPEHCRGRPLDARSDCYALAATLYEVLAGRRCYEGDARTVMRAHVAAPVPRLREHAPECSAGMEEILVKALAKDPDDRFADADAFARALRRLERGLAPLPGRRGTAGRRATRGTATRTGEVPRRRRSNAGAGHRTGERTTSGEVAPPRFAIPPAARVGGLVLVALLLATGVYLMVAGGGEGDPGAEGESETVVDETDPEGRSGEGEIGGSGRPGADYAARLRAAERGIPDELAAFDAYLATLDELAAEPVIPGAERRIAALRHRAERARHDLARSAFDDLIAAVLADAKAGDHDVALARLDAAPPAVAAQMETAIASARRARERAAAEAYAGELDAVAALIDAGDLDAARTRLASAADGNRTGAAAHAGRREELAVRLEAAEDDRVRLATLAPLDGVIEPLLPFLRAGDWDRAERHLRFAQPGLDPAARSAVDECIAAVTWLADREEFLHRAGSDRIGERIAITTVDGRVEGTLHGWNEEGIEVAEPIMHEHREGVVIGHAVEKIPWSRVDAEERARILARWEAPDGIGLARALLAVAEGEEAAIHAHLEDLPDRGLALYLRNR